MPPACATCPAARLEGAKLSLEAEIKELRKAAKEELSELKLEQNCAKQAAYEIREAAERRQQQLGEALAAAEARCEELEEEAAGARRATEAAQRAAGKLERQLAELQAEQAALQEAHDQARRRAGAGMQAAAGAGFGAAGPAAQCCHVLIAWAAQEAQQHLCAADLCVPACSCKPSTAWRSAATSRWWQTARSCLAICRAGRRRQRRC